MSVSDDRVIEIVEFCLEYGDDKTVDTYDLTHESLAVYKRRYKNQLFPDKYKKKKLLQDIADKYSDSELLAISKGSQELEQGRKTLSFDGEKVSFYAFTDTHFGSKYTNLDNYKSMCDVINNDKDCQFVVHCGDVTEGMSNRQGHIYELTHLGFEEQKEHSVEMLDMIKAKKYMISGNHDRWFFKQNGADIVKQICAECQDAEFLGHDEGDLVVNGARIKLWHGLDGSSYATSYRLQKLIESFTGGQKPNVLICGHTHKQGYFFERHIHAITAGCIESQSKWMRGKKLAAHTGFWKISMTVQKKFVTSFTTTWFPFYE